MGTEWHVQIGQPVQGIEFLAPLAFPGFLDDAEKSAQATSVVVLIGGIVALCSRVMLVNESLNSGIFQVYSISSLARRWLVQGLSIRGQI